ncbi:DUF1254 domain-containing protein [Chitinophaga sp. RAB17]|uniref:DUF1254 domain-containing protein n=1 Tax=Chitinophaga sp. RAB17 TaxID=3233049 RepID=UPI003F932E61
MKITFQLFRHISLSMIVIGTCMLVVSGCKQNSENATSAEKGAGRYDYLSGSSFEKGFPTRETIISLTDELKFQRAVQSYLWSLPAINMWAMKEGSEKIFGAGYNILPVWTKRLDARTKITTPNSDLIYAMGYLDLKKYGALVVETPPGILGMFDDMWQKPIMGPSINGTQYRGDVGIPGPDKGAGGKYLLLPPDYKGSIPQSGYYVYRSETYNVFLFWRAFYKDPSDLSSPVAAIKTTKIYPYGKESAALPMQFPDASGEKEINMLFPEDGAYFDMLDRFIQEESVMERDLDMRGFLHTIGIEKDKKFAPSEEDRKLLNLAAVTAFKTSKVIINELLPKETGGLYYKGRQWVNTFAGENTSFQSSGTFTNLEQRTAYFTSAYSDAPAMVVNMINSGAKYPATSKDADGEYLDGGKNYSLHLPANIPAKIFWSLAAYNSITASGLDNGQPFPSLNAMDKPVQNADGSIDLYLGPKAPQGKEKNWIATVPDKGYFVILRLYAPEQAFFDQTWQPEDIKKVK